MYGYTCWSYPLSCPHTKPMLWLAHTEIALPFSRTTWIWYRIKVDSASQCQTHAVISITRRRMRHQWFHQYVAISVTETSLHLSYSWTDFHLVRECTFAVIKWNANLLKKKKSPVTLMSWKFLHFHTCVFRHWSHVNIKPTKWKRMQPGRDKQFLFVTQHPDQVQAVRSWAASWPLSALKDWARGTFCTMLGHHPFHLRWRRFPLHLLRKYLLDPNHFSKTGKAHASKSLLL